MSLRPVVVLCFRALVSLVVAVAIPSCGTVPDVPAPPSAAPDAGARASLEPVSDRGAELFASHCAACHGVQGRGDTWVAASLFPRPRDLGRGLFHLVSTDNGVPTRDDVLRTLRRGLPGSAMPSYSWMPGGDLEELSSHVLDLAVTGLAEILEDDARQRGTRLPREVALQRARWWMEPGEPIGSPPEVEVTPAVLDRGRELFTSYCAACHGEDGKGRRAPRGWAPGSEVTWSRDLTRGLLRGEATRDEIYRRIRSGMPGSAMPPTRLDSPADQAALLAYVLDLLPTSGSDPFIQTRRTLIVSKALAGLPSSPGDTRWETAVTTLLPLMPLFSSEGSILEVEVACLHRGDEIAVRITWDDATCDDRSLGGSPFPDGVAMQLTGEMDPPLFGMGAMAHPVRIWHWKAFELRDEAGSLDLLGSSRSGATPDTPATCPVSSGGTTTNLVATGPGAMEKTTAATSAEAVFNDGQWSVVLRGSLVGDPGTPAGRFLAVAIWNGSAGESGVRKSVTTWHELSIGR